MSSSSAPGNERQWRTWLAERLTELLGRPVTEQDAERPLHEFGVSSRAATMLAAQAGQVLGRELTSTLVWEAPTIAELARTLAAGGTPADSAQAANNAAVDNPAAGDPVAIVGLGCRFPGASGPAEFWSMLTGGVAALGEVPAGRWECFTAQAAEHDVPRSGGFLDDVAAFDAEFFGISPREAEVMDPQQRLLLEVTWEALAHAGIPARSLRGSDCGVFVGLSATEYAQLTMNDLDQLDPSSATGAAASVAANRISYALGVHGPSVTVDTACSSSLVAVHHAVRALADGDASAAIVGGVNVLLSPGITANFQLAGALAADGRCKPFDAAADGIVRGEGCGVVVLKSLADARRAGDRVLAVIRGSTVNSDGRSNGLMAPNPVAQRRLLAKAYAKAGVRARTVDYVEAHGTGTLLGDPIEAGALAEVLGADRAARTPLLLGSVKSNLGHLEGAAGIAGLIKVALSLWHSRIPPSLNFTAPNPHIDFAAGRQRVVTGGTEWPRYPGIARCGVSSFGFGGTNAHVVLEEAPRTKAKHAPPGRPDIVALSARSAARLRARADALARALDSETSTADLAAALLHGEDQETVRAAFAVRDHTELRERLAAVAAGRRDRAVSTGTAGKAATAPGPVFVCSGQGSQWPAMGRRLLAEEPAFREAVLVLDGPFAAHAGVSLSALLDGSLAAGGFAHQQLALFGMQVALAGLWRGYGVRPAAVVGNSMGEVGAAVVAGALDPVDGLKVMVARARLLGELDAGGAMAAVELSAAELAELLPRFPGVAVAVYASPAQCTVTGPGEQIDRLVSHVDSSGRMARTLPIGRAGHSTAVDPLLERLRESLGRLATRPAEIPFYTTVLDDPRQGAEFATEYWVANLRRPVRFEQALTAAMADGYRTFVELSPHPIIATAAEQTADALGVTDLDMVPTIRRDPDDTGDGFAAALAAMHVAGHPEVLPHRYPRRVVADLPPPVWQHRRYWATGRSGQEAADTTPAQLAFEARWTPRELPPVVSHEPRRWILLHEGDVAGMDRAAEVAALLAARGHEPVLLSQPGRLAEHPDIAGVVVLPPTPESPAQADAASARDVVRAVTKVVRILTDLPGEQPRLWLATCGAATVRAGEAGRPDLAALRGLVRVLGYEHPELLASWVDLSGGATEGARELVAELLADPPEDESAWRDGRRFAHLLTRAEVTDPGPADAVPVVRDGAYVITGGLGGLGLVAARWLAERGASRIVLCGRREPHEAAAATIEQLRASGPEIVVATGDIAEPGVAGRLVHSARADGVPLRGVLHAAGVLADGAVLAMRVADLDTAWRAKTEGAMRLHEACAGVELDWWLAYSSAAGLFGSPGQAAYATANAWLDAFAAWRRGQGLPATTIQWGAWAEVGGAAGRDNPVLEPMPVHEGVTALSAVLAAGRAETAITRLDTAAVLELFPKLAERPFFAALVADSETGPATGPGTDALRVLAEGGPERGRVAIRDHVRAVLDEMMWGGSDGLDPHEPLTSLGLDSLLAMRARGAIERDFGVTIPLPLLLRGASLTDLAEHLAGELAPADAPVAAKPPPGPGARDVAERWITRLWRQVLDGAAPAEIAVNVPFATAGGDAAAMARLREAVSDELGRTVTDAELCTEPTIAGMANVVRGEQAGHGRGPVRVLSGENDGPALFLFQAAGSPTAAYLPLTRLLPADVTTYGMERLGELDTVQAKAARYVELIRQRQPDGPYRLGGWSFGGLLAFETARQLIEHGAEIELLFLIDTIIPLPAAEGSPADALRGRLRRFVDYIEHTYQVDLGLPADDLAELDETSRNEAVLRRLAERVDGMGEAVIEHQQTSYLDARIAERYTPTTYPGPVLLFRAKDPHPLTTTLDPRYLRTDDALGWDEFCAYLEITRVPGDHITVLDPPHVEVIADRLWAALRPPRE